MTAYTYYVVHLPTGKGYYGVRYAKNANPSDLWVKYFTSCPIIKNLIKQDGKEAFKIEIRRIFKTAKEARAWEFRVIKRIMHWPHILNRCAFPAVTEEAHQKAHLTKSQVGLDGLTGYQRSGKKWKNRKHLIDPETGLTFAELKRQRHNITLDINGTRNLPRPDISGDKNPSKRLDVKNKISNTLKDGFASGRIKTTKGYIFPQISEFLKGNQHVKDKLWYTDGTKDIRLFPNDPRTIGLTLGRSIIVKGRTYKKVICPHCDIEGGGGNMIRFHFDNCKKKPK